MPGTITSDGIGAQRFNFERNGTSYTRSTHERISLVTMSTLPLSSAADTSITVCPDAGVNYVTVPLDGTAYAVHAAGVSTNLGAWNFGTPLADQVIYGALFDQGITDGTPSTDKWEYVQFPIPLTLPAGSPIIVPAGGWRFRSGILIP